MSLRQIARRSLKAEPALLAHSVPCPLPDTVIPTIFLDKRNNLLRDAKLATIPSTNLWSDIPKFASFHGNCLSFDLRMPPYGFGMWITPQDHNMSIMPITDNLSGQELVNFMAAPDSRDSYFGKFGGAQTVYVGGAVYIPLGKVFQISGKFAIAGFVLANEDLVAWARVLFLQIKYPQCTWAGDVRERAAGFLRAVGFVIERSQKEGDVAKFGGQGEVDTFWKVKKECETLLGV